MSEAVGRAVVDADEEVVEGEKGTYVIARFGTVMNTLPEEPNESSPAEFVNQVVEALGADPRLPRADPHTLEMEWTGHRTMYPGSASSADLLVGKDAFYTLIFTPPIRWEVRVPLQHQPPWHGERDQRAESYEAAWDGCTLAVAWAQPDGKIPLAGGQIVKDVLQDAVSHAGGGIYAQGCRPQCQNIFLHTDLTAVASDDTSAVVVRGAGRPRRGYVSALDPEDPGSVVDELEFMRGTFRDFADAKNLGRRLLEIERAAREDLTHLLIHQHEHAAALAAPVRTRLDALWKQRGWRREAKVLIARLWLAMSNADLLLRQWESARQEVSDDDGRGVYEVMLAPELEADDASLRRLDLAGIQTALHDAAGRFDARLLAAATALGVLGGTLSGALVTVLLT